MCTDTDEWCKIWRAIDLSFQNWHEKYYKFWLQALECLKSCTLMGSLWPKFIIFELKRYREVIIYDTKEWYKIWRKTDLWFEKWHEEFGKISPEHRKVSKLGLLFGPFIQSRKCMSLKFTGKFCVVIMKNDAKLEKELAS